MTVRRRSTVIMLVALALLGVLTVLAFAPPPARSAAVPAGEFSAERAAGHLEQIALRPHPTGSGDNERVRAFLLQQARSFGAAATVESGEVVRHDGDGPFSTATVHNVVARVPGIDPAHSGGKALLFVAHYDSVPTGPGAADNGAAVAAMLETMRAVLAGGRLRNDVVFLFTDGEELGGLGAELFARRHDIDDYGAVLNWEARGSSGPVLLFETSQGNARLLDAYARTGSRPAGNSLAYEIYQRMPNLTDFTVFRDAGAVGLNAAFLDGFHQYHSVNDDIGHLDRDSLQHHGEMMVGLAGELGDADLRVIRSDGDTVYFDVFARVLVRYPAEAVVWAAVATLLILAWLIGLGARRSTLRVRGVLVTAGVGVGVVAGTAGAAFGLWWLVLAVRQDIEFLPLAEPYEREWFVAGFLAAAAAVLVAAARSLRGTRPAESIGGVLVLGAVLLVVLTPVLPGATYLLQWPVLAGIPALWWSTRRTEDSVRAAVVGVLLTGLPAAVAIVLYAPLVGAVLVALGVQMAAAALVIAAIGGLLVLPLLTSVPRAALAVPVAATVLLMGVGVARSGYERTEPRTDALLYFRNHEDDSAAWLTGDPEPDAWTAAVFGESPRRVPAHTYLPRFGDDDLLTVDAPALDLPPPEVSTLADTTSGTTRSIRFSVASQRDAWQLSVRLPSRSLYTCTVAGVTLDATTLAKHADRTDGVLFEYTGDGADLELSCVVAAGEPIRVEVADLTIGLPERVAALVGPRPDDAIPVPFGFAPTDAAIARRVAVL
ncbi:M20/M25/M40 family metallo-hydrolase [Amycolatopsis magusensis]|uniref:Peptidase M28 domain-containing protein n=1 Tax=Amycolatopsis magusensis TaxID=882444 RepID=A0ABS4PU45_9PSEU|nr:M20/M25/M40 family metallo-hydrolase [Amycolatopsis magusensis]MBP2182954.1 hypothetical protein [Amycolatopsis magusensis]